MKKLDYNLFGFLKEHGFNNYLDVLDRATIHLLKIERDQNYNDVYKQVKDEYIKMIVKELKIKGDFNEKV